MSINPSKLRTAIESGLYYAVEPKDIQLVIDAMEIADSCARADVESHCHAVGNGSDPAGWWWDTSTIDAEDKELVGQSIRYVEARGMVDHHPQRTELVRFKEPA